jgi:hypothetical protein
LDAVIEGRNSDFLFLQEQIKDIIIIKEQESQERAGMGQDMP